MRFKAQLFRPPSSTVFLYVTLVDRVVSQLFEVLGAARSDSLRAYRSGLGLL